VFTPNTNACDDGQACSENDQCSNGVCVGESNLDCDDQNPCTEDRCDDSLGCVHSYNLAACDDENACTDNDACSMGVCGGQALACDDGNACTSDNCDPAAGCQHVDNTDPCDDDDVCTVGDVCSGGVCQAGGARNCNDNEPCTDDACVAGLGCTHANNSNPCDDGDACTDGDRCQAGACVGGASPFDCDDGNPCTDDNCDPINGCSYVFNTDACDDSDPCTMSDVCFNGACSGVAMDGDGDGFIPLACGGQDCNDADPNINPSVFEGPAGAGVCTDTIDNNCNGLTDLAEASCGSCNDNADCDDNNVCNGAETCVANSCVAGTPLACGDGNVCTTDNCDPVAGCQYTNNTLPCSDNNACTVGDVCSGGSCQAGGSALNCNDSNPCTTDTCAPASGCVYTNNTAACDDGNQCTTGDTCAGGVCQPGGGSLDCNDSDPCTSDSCVPASGCNHGPLDGGNCDDGNGCTTGDVCVGGVCIGSGINCNDNNVCTTDTCSPSTGCVYTNNNNNCNDGDACTVSDRCQGGACSGTIRDVDGDGYGDGETCAGDDCDDSDPAINPAALEACGDGVDNNCNRVIDEGCSGCAVVDPAAELRIDNDNPFSGYGLAVGDTVFNIFFVETPSYNALEVSVAFYDFSGGSGNGQGNYSAHIFVDEAGLPGAEVAASGVETVNTAWDPTGQAFHTFTLSNPGAFTQGQVFWVGVRSEQDQTTNGFLPLVDGGIAVPYQGGALFQQSDGQYYGVMGNFLLRVHGCAEGPWLALSNHVEAPLVVPAGGSATSTVTLRNRGFANASGVAATMTANDPEIVITTGNSTFGNINTGATAAGSPAFGLSAAAGSYGIFPLIIDSTDGPNAWADAYGVYVQGAGCGTANATLVTDNGVLSYIIPPAANDEMGNYFVVQTTSFNLTSVDVQMQNTTGPANSRFRLKVYTYRAGLPDKAIYTGSWRTISGTNQFTASFPVSPALTFKEGDTFFAMIQSESNLSATDFSMITDDGDSQNNSWMNGLLWDASASTWSPLYLAWAMVVNGCVATDLVYESHTSTPNPIQKGQPATLNITIRNVGAQAASGVSGTLSSSSPDVTVTTPTRSFGNVAAGGTATANGFQISVSAGAPGFQYLLGLQLTDGTSTWDEVVPIQLAGGSKNLTIQNFTTVVVGNDIQYHWEVANTGNVDVIGQFDVDLYIDRASAPGVGVAGDWTDSPTGLAVGQSIPYDLVLPDAPAGNYDAWVQVDTNNSIAEANESDNVAGPSSVSIGAADTFELLSPARKWFPADMPVRYRFVSGNSQPGISQTEARNAVRNGFAQWQNVASANITFTEVAEASSGLGGFREDGFSTMSFNDPLGELPSGALAATLPLYNGQTMVTNGVTFYRMTDSDMVFNNAISFVRNGAACSNQYDMDGVATHELGHLVGLDHPDVFSATMYYAIGPCDMTKLSLDQSDIAGVTFIYP
jgi:hypothetical protein